MVFLRIRVGSGIQAHLYCGVNAPSCFYLWYLPGRARYRPSYQDQSRQLKLIDGSDQDLQQQHRRRYSILVKHDIDLRWFAVIRQTLTIPLSSLRTIGTVCLFRVI